ncbi:hypothetical protein ES706_01380 [subsurface metagenome]|nr:oligosaccharide flippase family protein [Dehalococcoidia bacterium]
MKPLSFIRATFLDALGIVRSPREGLKSLYGISLYRNAVYLMLNSAILALTGFFFWAVAARLYPVEGVGLASAAISAMSLLAVLSTLGLTYGLIRFLPKAGEKSRDMINSCFTIGGLTSIALSLIFLAGLPFWSPALLPIREHPVFFAAFIIFAGAITFQSFTQQTFVAKRKAGFALAQGLTFGLLRFIPLVALAALFHTFGIFASWGIAASVAVAIGIFLFLPKVQAGYRPVPTIRRQAINDMMHFSFVNYAANILWAIPTYVLPLMVVNLLGAEQNAYFYIARAIASVLFMIPLAASFSLLAEGSHNEERLASDIKRSLRLILFLLIPAIIIIFFLGDKILLFFGAVYSENATRLLRILAISALPVSLNYIYFSIKRVEMKMKGVIGLSAFIAVATLALSHVLLPRMGIIGAGIAWLVSQAVVAVVTGCKLWRRQIETH